MFPRNAFKYTMIFCLIYFVVNRFDSVIAWGPFFVLVFISLAGSLSLGWGLFSSGVGAVFWRDEPRITLFKNKFFTTAGVVIFMAVLTTLAYGWAQFYSHRAEIVYSVSPATGEWLGMKKPGVEQPVLTHQKHKN